jgi:hypothetical protein
MLFRNVFGLRKSNQAIRVAWLSDHEHPSGRSNLVDRPALLDHRQRIGAQKVDAVWDFATQGSASQKDDPVGAAKDFA